jgi:alpha-beta hydrolase superfamily lysophospholipase
VLAVLDAHVLGLLKENRIRVRRVDDVVDLDAEVVRGRDVLVRGLDEAPIIMGHSFGGLITELLLDRGLGAAGVGISPAQIKGVVRLPPAQIRVTAPVLGNPANRKRTVELSPKQFHYAFTNALMTDEQARSAYERYEVPGPGRVLFQAAFANFNPNAATKVDIHKDDRPPLLVIGNSEDHTVPASVAREAAHRLAKSKAVVDYKEFMGRPHFTAGAPGWEEVADYALEWAMRHAGSQDGAAGMS